MNDRQAEGLIEAVNSVSGNLFWIALWLFCLMATSCGKDTVKATVKQVEDKQVIEKETTLMESLDALDEGVAEWRKAN